MVRFFLYNIFMLLTACALNVNSESIETIQICYKDVYAFNYEPQTISKFKEPCEKTKSLRSDDKRYQQIFSIIQSATSFKENNMLSINAKITQPDGNFIYIGANGEVIFSGQIAKKMNVHDAERFYKIMQSIF